MKFNEVFYLKIILIISGLFFLSYYFMNQNGSEIETEIVYVEDIFKEADAFGLIFKDEKVVNIFNQEKLVKYIYNNGEHISANSDVAMLFEDETELQNFKKIKNIQNRIDNLITLKNDLSENNQAYIGINQKIYSNFIDILNNLKNNNFNEIGKNKKILIENFNKKQILNNNFENVDELINCLKKELNLISRKNLRQPQIITTPYTGYFVNLIDGFEEKCDLDKSIEIDEDELKQMYDSFDNNQENIRGFKIIVNPKIIFKTFIPITTNFNCDIGDYLTLKMESINEKFEAELIDLKLNKLQKGFIATFEINGMTQKLASLRKSQAKINFKKYNGLKINKTAIRQNSNGKNGVYVLCGSMLKFKLIDIIAENLDFVVCKPYVNDSNYLQELDLVVVSGKNLYENRRLNKNFNFF